MCGERNDKSLKPAISVGLRFYDPVRDDPDRVPDTAPNLKRVLTVVRDQREAEKKKPRQ